MVRWYVRMKIDYDKLRAIVIEIESLPPSGYYSTAVSQIPGNRDELDEYLALLEDAGWIRDPSATSSGRSCVGLTWQGHQYLDSIRDQSVWMRVRERMQAAGVSASVELVKALALNVGKELLGL